MNIAYILLALGMYAMVEGTSTKEFKFIMGVVWAFAGVAILVGKITIT